MDTETNLKENDMTKRIEGDFYGVNMNPGPVETYIDENVGAGVFAAAAMTIVITAALVIVNTLHDLQHAGIL